MSHRLFFLSSLFFATAVSGCASHSVRPGIWEFTYRLERIRNRTNLPKKTQEVILEVEWAADQPGSQSNPRVQEVVLISPIKKRSTLDPESNLPRVGIRPMYGEIEAQGENWIFRVPPHMEQNWAWQLSGEVENPHYIRGIRFDARIMQVDEAEFEGTWSLQWVRDE